ncbi:hypothetical protein CJ030_MR6G004360 [Morella rubra]|uniref:Uncharacterized protein n=1 Tax=Morella rubra TaxID=262757 RepID=A0A6A1VDF4_9ROSI|nr:hypothetical protein CJ030_MR6G004360 [Morella rubra]
MESASEMVPFPLLTTPIESNYRACTIPYRFPSDNPRKPTPSELVWIDLFANSIPSFKKRAESDPTVPDASSKAEIFAQRLSWVLVKFNIEWADYETIAGLQVSYSFLSGRTGDYKCLMEAIVRSLANLLSLSLGSINGIGLNLLCHAMWC